MGITGLVDELAALVLKSGVGLGGLTQPQRQLALAVPALALAPDRQLTEPEVNALLKRALAEEAAFLDTDHVELRRWLVDAGWWQRDGFGRAYQRVPMAQLADDLRVVAVALRELDLPTWVAARRDELRLQREARRSAWAARTDGIAGA